MKPIVVLSIYNIITLLIVTVLLVVCSKKVRKDSTKDRILKLVSLAVVIIHHSILYVEFFATKGTAELDDSMLFPYYPCNIIMWLLVIAAYWKNKESKAFKILAEFLFIVGTVCGLVGVLYNFNFLDEEFGFRDFKATKGLLSHTVMIFGTLYLGVMKYVKIRVPNTMVSIFCGLMFFVTYGYLLNIMLIKTGIDEEANAMYLMEPPIPSLPFLNFLVLGSLGYIFAFICLLGYERLALPKEERWLNKILNREGN